jgi:hypothetical protein
MIKETGMSQTIQNSFLTNKSLPVQVSQAKSSCCSTTKEGASICIVPESGSASACGCSGSDQEEAAELLESDRQRESISLGGKIRSGVLFGFACLASPCCTPLYVPLLLIVLAGTPAAIWLSANIGWVYGALTLISIISFVLAFRWWPQLKVKQHTKTAVQLETQPLSKTNYSLEK